MKSSGLKLKTLLALALLLPLGVRGQDRDSPIGLSEVRVSAARPMQDMVLSVRRMDSLVMAEHRSASLAELLAGSSNVLVKRYGPAGLATVSFRGTAASHTQVSWNGLRLNNPMLGQVDFSLIPVYFIDELEILNGPSSLKNGSGALGGSIQLRQRADWNPGLRASAMLGAGSFGLRQGFVSAAWGRQNAQFRVRAYREKARNDFPFVNTANGTGARQRQQGAEYSKSGAMLEGHWRLAGKHVLSASAWLSGAERALPPIMSYQGAGRTETQTDQDNRLALSWKAYRGERVSELVVGLASGEIAYFLANHTPTQSWVNFDTRSRTTSLLARHEWRMPLLENLMLRALSRAEWDKATYGDLLENSTFAHDRQILAHQSSLHWTPLPRWNAYGLLALEAADGQALPLLPAAGLEFLTWPGARLALNWARNFHLPSLNDLHWRPGGNPDLRPENGHSFDLSLDIAHENAELGRGFALGLSLFSAQVRDWIVWTPSPFGYWTAENLRQVWARGIESSLRLETGGPRHGFALDMNYALTRTTQRRAAFAEDASLDKQLIYIPLHSGNLLLSARWKRTSASLGANAQGRRHTESTNLDPRLTLPAYALLDASLSQGIAWKGWDLELRLEVENLLDTAYQTMLWRAMPGRGFRLALRVAL